MFLKDGIKCHAQFLKSGLVPPIFTSNQLIHLYANHCLIHEAQKLFDEMPERNVVSWNVIISAYVKSNHLPQAKALFDSASVRDLVTYNTILSGYANADGYQSCAIELFLGMQRKRGEMGIDEVTLTTMVNLFAKLCSLTGGRQLHSYMIKTGNDRSGFAVSSLIDMYSKCGCFGDACLVFKGCEGPVDLVSKNAIVAACCKVGEVDLALRLFWRANESNDTVSWNTMISGLVQNSYEEKALELFIRMWKNRVKFNEHTFASILGACCGLRNLKLGKEVHAWILKNDLISNAFINSGIVDLYCKCGNMKYAESACSISGFENPFSITSMIVGCSMQGNMIQARRLFNSLAEKNHVVWTALFSGYVKSQQSEVVFDLLKEFREKEATTADVLILVSVLNACASQSALNPGKQIHGYLFRMGFQMDEKMTSALIDMYSKCGSVAYAENIFRRAVKRDSVTYNVMIACYAHHGQDVHAMHLFREMLEKGVRPDSVTLIALLSACRHAGFLDMGEKLFYSMKEGYNISPEIEHYGCMVDLYGRAMQLEKAVELFKQIPESQQDVVLLGAFLNACRLNRNVELAREVEERILKTERDKGARFVQLANAYAAEGNWDEMGRIRKLMKGNEAKKFAGCSWLYLDHRVHIFTSGDTSHFQAKTIYSILASLTGELCHIGRGPCVEDNSHGILLDKT
ncbi:hypothetical protein K2173_002252 [Erythroxylum novogranatense]|uniref:Pentatricopeptide repeat-containing protein n=1 Tax=Erythroxylum novogranatense TaxID=1862640 RepID=A0AAV8TAJ1_9ROSI|nr:hypothetical protein K2173_002252 [Erythroxylum novogranatense]